MGGWMGGCCCSGGLAEGSKRAKQGSKLEKKEGAQQQQQQWMALLASVLHEWEGGRGGRRYSKGREREEEGASCLPQPGTATIPLCNGFFGVQTRRRRLG